MSIPRKFRHNNCKMCGRPITDSQLKRTTGRYRSSAFCTHKCKQQWRNRSRKTERGAGPHMHTKSN